jgi:hypothetical protein
MTTIACTGHVLLDLPIFFGPVAVITLWILVVRQRDRMRSRRSDLSL